MKTWYWIAWRRLRYWKCRHGWHAKGMVVVGGVDLAPRWNVCSWCGQPRHSEGGE